MLGRKRVVDMVAPIMGAEDFSYVLAEVPGALAFLGGCPPGVDPVTAPPNHSNRVVFDEAAMVDGVALYAGLALRALRC
jgi:hippurate hydrolase